MLIQLYSLYAKFIYYISREAQPRQNVLATAIFVSVCLSVCLSPAAFLHYCTDPDVTWENDRSAL